MFYKVVLFSCVIKEFPNPPPPPASPYLDDITSNPLPLFNVLIGIHILDFELFTE